MESLPSVIGCLLVLLVLSGEAALGGAEPDQQARGSEIWHSGKWIELEALDSQALYKLQDTLEHEYEIVAGSALETAVRQKLRAIRHRLGPNTDPAKAFEWRIVSLLARRVELTWEDEAGHQHSFEADITDPGEWVAWIRREMATFSRYVFEKSWGKIKVSYIVRSTTVPILHMKRSKGEYWLDDRRVSRLVKGKFKKGQATSLFVWVPRDGKGTFPPTGATATAVPGTSFTNGAHFTAFYTSAERMSTPGRWAKERGGGMIHEFWHHARWVLSREPVNWRGWRPSVNSTDDWVKIQEEVRAQGLEPSDNRYDEFFPSWFTWRMIRRLRGETVSSDDQSAARLSPEAKRLTELRRRICGKYMWQHDGKPKYHLTFFPDMTLQNGPKGSTRQWSLTKTGIVVHFNHGDMTLDRRDGTTLYGTWKGKPCQLQKLR